jgi:chromatin segregation and condensation protein Rec8/ScpA/Scc1 (kleisin family)
MSAAKQKLVKHLVKTLRNQRRALQEMLRLAVYHHNGHRSPTREQEKSVTDLMRAWYRPVNMWETEALTRIDLQDKNSKRQAGIVRANNARQQKAGGEYRRYRKIATALSNQNPTLRHSRHRLAQLVQAELKRQGQNAPSVRTISTALKK